jgi:exonuclease III
MSINSNTTPHLSIILWNANGLKKHANELYYFLHNKNIDLTLISETHLKKYTNFKINRYKIIRADHPDGSAHAGAAILIKSSILYTNLQSINKTYLQAANISINFNNCIPITISSVYFPPPNTTILSTTKASKFQNQKYNRFFKS